MSVALHHRSSTLYQIHYAARYLYFLNDNATEPYEHPRGGVVALAVEGIARHLHQPEVHHRGRREGAAGHEHLGPGRSVTLCDR